MPGRRTTALAALVAALVCVGSVRAHGDPATDWLAAGTLFHSFDTRLSPSALDAVSTTIDRSKLAGYPVRVALIERPADLGTLARLWGRPEAYAHHLSVDLRSRYAGPFLVVMPAGAGVARSDGSAAAERRVAAAVRVTTERDGLAVAAIDAVAALAANAGHPFPPARVGSPGASSGASSALVVVSVVLALAFATSCLALVFVYRRSRAGTAS